MSLIRENALVQSTATNAGGGNCAGRDGACSSVVERLPCRSMRTSDAGVWGVCGGNRERESERPRVRIPPGPFGDLMDSIVFNVDNKSGGYLQTIHDWWESYGLGAKCLLIGENKTVASQFHSRYPNTEFLSVDFQSGEADFNWDICKPITRSLRRFKFTSIICQAVFEHIFDPPMAMRNFSRLLDPGGYLYLHMAGLNFIRHSFPVDTVRLHGDWFYEVPKYVPDLKLIQFKEDGGMQVFAIYQKDESHPG